MVQPIAHQLAYVVYFLTAVFGMASILFPAPSIEGLVGVSLVWVYGIAALVGGLGGLYSLIRPNFKIELIMLWPIATAWSVYDLSLWGLYVERLMNADSLAAPYGPGIAVFLLTVFLVWRLIFINSQAQRLLKEGKTNGYQ